MKQHNVTPEAAYEIGFDVLGPIFLAFAYLLLKQTSRSRLSRLIFLARDGELLREVVTRYAATASEHGTIELDYIHLSRRAISLPALESTAVEAIRQVTAVRADGSLLDLFCNYYSLPREGPLQADVKNAADLERLLQFQDVQEFITYQRQVQRQRLRLYLGQAGLMPGYTTGLVDIGWKANIQSALGRIFRNDPDWVPLPGFYFGFWTDTPPLPANDPGQVHGVIGDIRRGHSLSESAPWQASLLLEALCRAAHGPLAGYETGADGVIAPCLAEDTPARTAERAAEQARAPIRQGIFDYITAHARSEKLHDWKDDDIRRNVQRRLLRLVFFPSPTETTILGNLVHTESHAPQWSTPLIVTRRANPLLSPRAWLSGLTSPWRAGYVATTGGLPAACVCLGLEALLQKTPAGTRQWLRDQALRLSKT